MSWGVLEQSQAECVAKYVSGKTVHDLGAGDMALSRRVLELGAKHVVAVDKQQQRYIPVPAEQRAKVTLVTKEFRNYAPDGGSIDVALLSWPVNHTVYGLLPLLKRSRVLIYLGKNTDGVMCGTPRLFRYMLTRRLLVHVTQPENDLLILGDALCKPREPTNEERAGMDLGYVWSYTGNKRQKVLF